jgi:hypothetical protein
LKLIGVGSDVPDIIIKENFGPNSNLNLYSCVFSYNEIISGVNGGYFFPLIRLIQISTDFTKINSISIQCTQCTHTQPITNLIFGEWELYWTEEYDNQPEIKTLKIDKNITSSNIIEKLIFYSS